MDGFFWFKPKNHLRLDMLPFRWRNELCKIRSPLKGSILFTVDHPWGLFSNSCHATIKIVQRKHKQKVQLDLTNFRKENLK